MPLQELPKELPFKWRQVATPITVTAAALAQLILEEKLENLVVGGYTWAARKTQDGYDLYRAFHDWDGISVSTTATANPAAGANAAEVTVAVRTLLIGGYELITNGVGAANRVLMLNIKHDGTNIDFVAACPGVNVASEAGFVSFGAGLVGNDSSNVGVSLISIPVPGIEMAAGAKFQLVNQNIQVADDNGPLYYYYKEALA